MFNLQDDSLSVQTSFMSNYQLVHKVLPIGHLNLPSYEPNSSLKSLPATKQATSLKSLPNVNIDKSEPLGKNVVYIVGQQESGCPLCYIVERSKGTTIITKIDFQNLKLSTERMD